MNKYRGQHGYFLREGHNDEISEEKLVSIMESLKRVADNTDTTLNQVINVYDAASRNRLTEVLLDNGDAFDRVISDIKGWKQSDGFVRLRLSGDDMSDEMRIQIVGED